MSKESKPAPWERQPGEPEAAWKTFVRYRSMERRSLDELYRQIKRERGDADFSGDAAGHILRWSRDWKWPDRCSEWDGHLDAEARAAQEQRMRELGRRRAEFEDQFQRTVELRFSRILTVLDKADVAPITDVNQSKNERDPQTGTVSVTRTKVKGINFAGYARLNEELRETGKQAVTGPREPKKVELTGRNGGPVNIVISADDENL